LFDDWDLPAQPSVQGPLTGEAVIAGSVRDDESGDLIPGASISVRLSGRLLAEIQTNEDGAFSIGSLPTAVVDVFVTASGYTRRHLRVDTASSEAGQMIVALRRPSQGERRLKISGVEVSISEEVEVDLGNGHILRPPEYLARARAAILERVQSIGELRSTWQMRQTRTTLEEHLAVRQVTPELLSLVLARSDVDGFDLLAAVAFDEPLVGLGARATAAETRLTTDYPQLPEAFIRAVLDKFRLGGVNEIATSEIFGLSPFVSDWGGVLGVAALCGGPAATGEFLRAVQVALFDKEQES
ncbi:MAG: hypothetical protein JWP57_4453, partial [Spirosoma sp.]|nr:hypothetical protein [Spirosoma sp.]